MIRPEIKRVLRFEQMKGKTVEEVHTKGFCLRIVFTDGMFVDLDTEADATAKIVIEKGKQRRMRPYH
jgi:hypothetical protein